MESGEEEGGLFLRFRLAYILILSLLLSLESLEKFVWWVVVAVCKPILVFSLSLSQAEQKNISFQEPPCISILYHIIFHQHILDKKFLCQE